MEVGERREAAILDGGGCEGVGWCGRWEWGGGMRGAGVSRHVREERAASSDFHPMPSGHDDFTTAHSKTSRRTV